MYLDLEYSNPVPIYCVASSHSLDDEYKWDRVGIKLPGNSPVMWVNVCGAYQCNIIRGGNTCASKVINVELKSESST